MSMQPLPAQDGVYHAHPWSGLPSTNDRQPRGCQYRATRLREALSEMLPTPSMLAPALYSSCGDIDHGKSAEGGVIHNVAYYWRLPISLLSVVSDPGSHSGRSSPLRNSFFFFHREKSYFSILFPRRLIVRLVRAGTKSSH